MEDYERHGFLLAACKRGITADMAVVDAHYGYYANRSILDRLHHDVIQPAREARSAISLVGISLGGLGALLYAGRYANTIDRVVALAPYLGPPRVLAEIAGAGGLSTWTPSFPLTCSSDEQELRLMWQGLQSRTRQRSGSPEIYLGYGEQDGFRAGHRLLAEALPRGHVVTVPGGHNWATWRQLWDIMLNELVVVPWSRRPDGHSSLP
jgi:S-formylglutathione hydrolase FrmB